MTASCSSSESGMKVPPIRGKSASAAMKEATAIPIVQARCPSAHPITRRYRLPSPMKLWLNRSSSAPHRPAPHVPLGHGVVPDRGEHRIERERDEEAHRDGARDRDAKLPEELPHDAAHEGDRNEDAQRGQRGRHDGQSDLARPLPCGGVVVFSHPHVPDDVLAHDDRIVDQDPDRERESHQRHHVERVAEGVDREEGRDHRHRERESRDHRGTPRVQECEDDQDGEQRPDDDRHLDVVDRVSDPLRVVPYERQVDPFR